MQHAPFGFKRGDFAHAIDRRRFISVLIAKRLHGILKTDATAREIIEARRWRSATDLSEPAFQRDFDDLDFAHGLFLAVVSDK